MPAHQNPVKRQLEILIVDDDALIRMLHKNRLEKSNTHHPLITCANGQETINYILANRSPKKAFLVLLDINMPIMNGWSFLEQCLAQNITRHVRVVVVSSSVNKADHEKAMSFQQVIAFCEKPFNAISWENLHTLKELARFFPPEKN